MTESARWWTAGWSRHHLDVLRSLDLTIAPHTTDEFCARWDELGSYPDEAMDALGRSGWAALPVPAEAGGEGAPATDLAVVHMTLGRRSLAVAQAYYSLWVLGAEAIARLGSPEQQKEWLPRIAEGKANVAFALTEPGSGSDASALLTKAEPVSSGWAVSGQKLFITGAARADVIVTAARTEAGQGRSGISLLLLDPRQHGVTIRPLRKIGLHAVDLDEVFLDGALVREHDVLGPLGEGWRSMSAGLAQERLYLAAISTGALVDLVERSLAHSTTRETFGKRIGDHQLIADKVVRMRMAAEASTQLVLHGAALLDAGHPEAATAASVAKLFSTEAYVTAAREAVQIMGGSGYMEETPVARHYRDSKYLEIGGGTSQIQTIIVARAMGLRP